MGGEFVGWEPCLRGEGLVEESVVLEAENRNEKERYQEEEDQKNRTTSPGQKNDTSDPEGRQHAPLALI